MRQMVANGQVFTEDGFISGGVVMEDGVITEVFRGTPKAGGYWDAHGGYIVPGFVDLHVHGGDGAEFMQGGGEAFARAARLHMRHGTTTLLPTSSACPVSDLEPFFEGFREAVRMDDVPRMPGAHLEGSYFALAQAGAQNPNFIVNPDPAEYLPILDKYPEIWRWTFAPELPGADDFLKELLNRGIMPSYGHTDANADDIVRAVKMGCTHACHLYSGMAVTRRINAWRFAGAVEGSYLCDDATVELICDGCHLPYELLQLAYKLKGPDKACLITDALSAAGAANGETCYFGSESALQEVIIEDDVAKMPDRQAFAGSIATADRLVRTAVWAGIPLYDAVKMMTKTPAAIAGIPKTGSFEIGNHADIVVFTGSDVRVDAVIKGGRIVSGGLESK
nr:amidohydrolase family protein [bacterium]